MTSRPGRDSDGFDLGVINALIEEMPQILAPFGITVFTDKKTKSHEIRYPYHSKDKGTEVVRVLLHGKEEGSLSSDINLCFKTYHNLSDFTLVNIRREAKVSQQLSKKSRHIVPIYHLKEERGRDNFTIVMKDLGFKTLGGYYRNLDELEIQVLQHVFNDQGKLFIGEGSKHRDELIVNGLRDIHFVVDVFEGYDIDHRHPDLANKRFELKDGVLFERDDFKKERRHAFKSALEAIIEFDAYALSERKNLGISFPKDTYGKRANRWISNWAYVAEMSGQSGKKEALEIIKNQYTKMEKRKSGFPIGLIMGNSKPMNFIYYHPEQGDPFSVAIDLYRTKYNVRVFRDAVSLLEIGRLTCDLSEDDYKSCKEHLFGLINDEKKSGFGKKQRNKISNRFKEQELFFVFDRLGAYYASACEDVVRALGPAFSYNLLEETGTTPTSATRKQAEFVINAAPELYTTVRNNQFPQDFKDTFIPYLKLSVNFREFVSNHLPASYLAKLDQHNKDVAGYLAKDVTP